MGYYIYKLQSLKTGMYYIGSSDNPKKRLIFHNSIEKGYTSRYRPWKIVFMKEFQTKKPAQNAEKKVKSWKSRKMLEKLINWKIDI